MAQSIEELQVLVDAWQEKEDAGGTPTSADKIASAHDALAEAKAASKPKKKAKKAKKAEVEEVPEVEEADEGEE